MAPDDILTVRQAAEYLGRDPDTIRDWANKGHIVHYRTPGKQRFFYRRDLDAFLARSEVVHPEAS